MKTIIALTILILLLCIVFYALTMLMSGRYIAHLQQVTEVVTANFYYVPAIWK